MSKKQKIVLGVVVVLILAAIIYFVMRKKNSKAIAPKEEVEQVAQEKPQEVSKPPANNKPAKQPAPKKEANIKMKVVKTDMETIEEGSKEVTG